MSDRENLKLCAAKYVWPRRNEKTPSGRQTWLQWFAEKYGDDLYEYRERMKK